MDIQAYISSGILESYALDTVSPQEKQEVECMSHIYPEIKEELEAIQFAMEAFASKSKMVVPSHVKANIFAAIENIPQESPLKKVEKEEKIEEAKTISLPPTEKKNSGLWKWAAAAAIFGFIVTTTLYLNASQKEEYYSAQLEQVTEEKKIVEQSVATLLTEKTFSENQLSFLADKNTAKVILNGTETHPTNQSVVYWNAQTKQGFIKTLNLPAPPSDQDYQLWAIVDGSPVSMGIVSINTTVDELQQLPEIANAQAFAITLEPKGGSPTPHLEQLFVIGNT